MSKFASNSKKKDILYIYKETFFNQEFHFRLERFFFFELLKNIKNVKNMLFLLLLLLLPLLLLLLPLLQRRRRRRSDDDAATTTSEFVIGKFQN